jgi:hypothetical protein
VAIELKDVMSSYFPEASQISALGVSNTNFRTAEAETSNLILLCILK